MKSKTAFDLVHALMVKTCLRILTDGEVVKDDEGVARTVTPSASMLAVVAKFLKDNNITDDSMPANSGRDLAAEARALLAEDEDQVSTPRPFN